MKRTLLLYTMILSSFSVLLAQPAEFDFTPNNTSGGAIATVTVDGVVASSSDFIAAFDETGNCAGAVQLLDYYDQAFCNLQVYGNDITTPDLDEGIDAGETYTFKLWVAASDVILDHPEDIEPVATWDAGLNGSPCPGYGFSDNVVLNFRGIAPPADEDGDGFSGADDPDDADPCNPNDDVTVCDTDGDGIPNGSDPFPDCSGTPDDGCDLTTDSFDANCVAINTADCADGTSFDAATCACTSDPVPGCTNADACNFDMNATEDDGSCQLPPTEPDTACYETATFDDASCDWVVSGVQPEIDDNCDITTDTFDEATCAAVNTPDCPAGTSFDAANCACTSDPVPGCTNADACNFDMNATEDDGSCQLPPTSPAVECYQTATLDNATCDWVVTGEQPAEPTGLACYETASFDDTTCAWVIDGEQPTCDAGTTFDPVSCECTTDVIECEVEAATISGGPFTFCVGDDTADFVSGITVDGGIGANSTWVVTDSQLDILGLPATPDVVNFDVAGTGTCLIWYILYDDITGANIGDNAANLDGCYAISNSIEVIREQCVEECTPPLAGEFDCE